MNEEDEQDILKKIATRMKLLAEDEIEAVRKAYDEISSTGSSMGGTITAANISVSNIQNELYRISKTGLNFESISSGLTEVKNKLAELETQKNAQSKSIKALEEFFDKNLQFMTIATQADGKMSMLEKQTDRIEKRLDQLEDKSSKTKDRTIAIWAVIISIVAIIASVAISLFIYFSKGTL